MPLIELLLRNGARTDMRDTLWDGTPQDWAIHEDMPAARAALGSGRSDAAGAEKA